MAQKLKFGNGTFATKEGSLLSYNDEGGNFKPLPFSFERNSIGTRVNKEGLIEVVGNDKPRIDYTNSADGVLLLEPSRTNLWTESEGTSITLNSPLGEFGFYTLKNNQIDRNIPSSDPISFTFIVKKIDGTTPTITGSSGNGDLVIYVGGGSSAGLSGNLTNIGDGFYKFEIIGYSNAGTGIEVIRNNSGVDTYVSLIQFEVGAYPTSYIPTSGSIVTRAAETANGAGNSEVFNDSEGVLFANISALADDGINRYISLSDGSTSNRVNIFFDNSNRLRGFYNGISGSIAINTDIKLNNKIAFKYKSGDSSFWLNGFEVATRTDALSLSGLDSVSFYLGGGSNFYGKTKEIGYYTVLTDLELETLTSYRSLNELVTELNLNKL